MTTITATTNLTIHRLLDEGFAGVPSTPLAQDLKEELRANLVARVEEIEATGLSAVDAARRAFSELGDIRTILDDAAGAAADGESPAAEWRRHQVKWRAGFVVRASILPIVSAAGLVLAFLIGAGLIPGGAPAAGGMMAVFALLLGFVCADSLQQETSSSYPMPRGRAIGYGVGLAVLLAGVGSLALSWVGPWPLWAWLVGGSMLTIAGIGVLAGLGATQTNRHKPWVREMKQTWPGGEASAKQYTGNRFERDPSAAARFGIYTAVLWIVAVTVGVLLGIFTGWWWSALPAIGAIVAMLLLVTQMLFKPDETDR